MWKNWASLAVRLGLAGVWLTSGGLKVADPDQSVIAVRAYQLLPDALIAPAAVGLPIFEVALGLLLLAGIGVRAVSILSALTLLVLIGVIASVWARGLSIDCGCFGGGGHDADASWRTYLTEILRDVGFLALAAWLVFFPRSRFALGPGSQSLDDDGSRRPPREGVDA